MKFLHFFLPLAFPKDGLAGFTKNCFFCAVGLFASALLTSIFAVLGGNWAYGSIPCGLVLLYFLLSFTFAVLGFFGVWPKKEEIVQDAAPIPENTASEEQVGSETETPTEADQA